MEKRESVKDMMRHAWRGYRENAWTENEVRPISGKGHSANIFGNAKTGATIVDALGMFFYIFNKDIWKYKFVKKYKKRYVMDHGLDFRI